jgi:hypothetical protein
MNTQKLKLPILIISLGILLAVISCLITCIIKEPIIKEHDFDYSVKYRIDGEEKTLEGVFKCSFYENDTNDISNVRWYNGIHVQNGTDLYERTFMVAQKGGIELHVVIYLDEAYLMGDADIYDTDTGNEDPYLIAYDPDGIEVEVSDVFNAEIISWEYPEPIENSFKFVGFSFLHGGSMLAMTLIGVLTIIFCIIFVKKDNGVEYKALDKISTVFNFIIGFAGIPFMAFCILLFRLVMSGDELMYQVYLCTPAITAFTIAASIALRRKGFRKSGMIVQFVCPVLFIGQIILESLIYNLFM